MSIALDGLRLFLRRCHFRQAGRQVDSDPIGRPDPNLRAMEIQEYIDESRHRALKMAVLLGTTRLGI